MNQNGLSVAVLQTPCAQRAQDASPLRANGSQSYSSRGTFSDDEITRFYRAADVCMVTSLHDGMNLVAKEFIAARRDEQGVLLLSRFTGAARELLDAVLVNPYDVERTADALHFALEMDPDERSSRMHRMRTLLKEHNVYRWAGTLITGLCAV